MDSSTAASSASASSASASLVSMGLMTKLSAGRISSRVDADGGGDGATGDFVGDDADGADGDMMDWYDGAAMGDSRGDGAGSSSSSSEFSNASYLGIVVWRQNRVKTLLIIK